MKRVILIALCLVMALGASAQMVNKKFVPMKDIDMFRYSYKVVETDADQFTAYIYPRRGESSASRARGRLVQEEKRGAYDCGLQQEQTLVQLP